MDYSRYKLIKVEKKDRIATITLNRPENLNAFDIAMHLELESLWLDVAADEEVRAIVLTGAGRAFSSGGDIKAMERTASDPKAPRLGPENEHKLTMRMLEVNQPIIAALNGDAVGLGATVALFCDIIIASETARIGDPHVRVGLVAGDGGAVIWPLLIGVAKAKEYLLTGALIPAPEAERIGLINRVVPADKVMSTAMELATSLANGPAKAIQWTKASVNKLVVDRASLVLDPSIALEMISMTLPDHLEAARAFLEKRQPRFE